MVFTSKVKAHIHINLKTCLLGFCGGWVRGDQFLGLDHSIPYIYRLAAIVKTKNPGNNSHVCPRHLPVHKVTAEFMLDVPQTITKGKDMEMLTPKQTKNFTYFEATT